MEDIKWQRTKEQHRKALEVLEEAKKLNRAYAQAKGTYKRQKSVDPEVSAGDEFIEINPTQDWDGSWYFIVDGEMILEEL
ncbi:hypothetical protein PG614_02480 [Riemerella anatipestifer]|nr:hypothetical protein [Riemerella anatipestifer]MDY3532639.1 hypothetical protein [Riemerella anatipestifer]MDY3534807.1 hypothetical protein [Riemerella anatipestifer]